MMELSADELTEARRVIARALEEDLRYGPDVTTLATVSPDASTTASMFGTPRAAAASTNRSGATSTPRSWTSKPLVDRIMTTKFLTI